MLLATLIHRASLPCPQISADQAAQLLEQHYGLTGALQSLGSQQDLNYRVDSERGRFVLKICRGDYAAIELQAQHAALDNLQAHVRVPKVNRALTGEDLLTVTVGGQTVHLRLLDYIDGQPLTHLPHLGRDVIAGFGELCGQVSRALKLGPSSSRSRSRFKSPWLGSLARLPRLEDFSRGGMLTDGRSCSSSCGSL